MYVHKLDVHKLDLNTTRKEWKKESVKNETGGVPKIPSNTRKLT